MNRKSYSQILDEVANDQIPANLNLAPAILARIQKGKGFRVQLKKRFVSAVLLTTIAITVLFFTVYDVKATIKRWFGFVPGVGLVSEGQIRVLEEPVSVTRNGITVTVEQVVLNHERTTLVYSVDGIPADAQTGQTDETFCSYEVSLHLPDGSSLLASPNGIDSWTSGYRHRFDYSTIPAEVNDAVLEISCLFHALPGSLPEKWEIPLHFIAAPEDMPAYQVIEIPASATPTDETLSTEAVTNTAPSNDGITLTLDQAVQMDDENLIYATLHWENSSYNEVDLIDLPETLHIHNAAGQDVPFELYNDDQTGIRYDQRQTVFAIKTAPVPSAEKLTLVLDAVLVNEAVNATFEFDPGANPQPGQIWQLGLEFNFGEHSLRIDTIKAEESSGYSFEMFSDNGICKASPVDLEHPVVSGFEGESDENHFFSGFYYAEGIPQEPVTFTFTSIWVKKDIQSLQANWSITENSDNNTGNVTANILPLSSSTCLTQSSWQVSLNQASVIPDHLPQNVLIYSPVDSANPKGLWETAIMNLNGTERKTVALERGMISPDGTKLVYPVVDTGIMVKNLETEEIVLLPGTIAGDSAPIWSPDGKSIIFMRGLGIFDLFSINLDGSNMRQLTTGGAQEIPLGWMADGSLLYSIQQEQVTVYRLNMQSGESRVFLNEDIRSISPDGRYLGITKLGAGDRWQVIIKEVDTENRWNLTDDNISVLNPIWSPDGQWLLVTVLSTDSNPALGALVNLGTCEVIALLNLHDDILAWIP